MQKYGELLALIKDLSNDLAAELNARVPPHVRAAYACEDREYQRDMAVVYAARRVLADNDLESYTCADCGFKGYGAWNCEQCGNHNLVR